MKFVVLSILPETEWGSCRSITSGLLSAYQQLGGKNQVESLAASTAMSDHEIMLRAEAIFGDSPDVIVFLDTWPTYGKFISALNRVYANKKTKPLLRFHAYGDFTLKAYLWLSWSELLKDFRVEWACASTPQRNMLEIFLTRAPSGESTVWVCPFPLKKEDFSFEPKERVRVREKLGFSQDDFVILYTGRMSLQKNVIAALRAFGHLPENISKRARLVFSGNFDDIGGPFEDCILPRWGMFWALMKEWDCLSLDIMDRVTLLPGMPRDELRGLYSAADVFLSLSLVHDEDYGLAVAEASSSGLPVVLTSWGGYEGFRQMGLEGKWIPVKLAQDGAVFSVSHAAFALQEIAEMQPRSSSSRGAAGAKAADSLSIDAVTKMIESQNVGKSHLIPKFSGFTDIMRELSECVNVRRGSLVFPAPAENSLYERVYRHYVPR